MGVEVVNITTTRDLYEAALRRAPEADVVIQAAAPADFRPAQYAQSKIKKSGEGMRLDLAANPDVARALGEAKREGQILVAFAAETNDLRENARGKLLRKNADLIVANDVTVPRRGLWHGHQLRPAHHARGRNRGAPVRQGRTGPSGFSIA